jgi:hypothetical protein
MAGVYRLCWNSNCIWLACAECDDAPDGIVRRDADSHPIAGNHFDTEAAHAAAELGQYFVAGIALHAVESPAVHSNDGALHVNKIIFAQLLADPFFKQTLCHTGHLVIWLSGYLVN